MKGPDARRGGFVGVAARNVPRHAERVRIARHLARPPPALGQDSGQEGPPPACRPRPPNAAARGGLRSGVARFARRSRPCRAPFARASRSVATGGEPWARATGGLLRRGGRAGRAAGGGPVALPLRVAPVPGSSRSLPCRVWLGCPLPFPPPPAFVGWGPVRGPPPRSLPGWACRWWFFPTVFPPCRPGAFGCLPVLGSGPLVSAWWWLSFSLFAPLSRRFP